MWTSTIVGPFDLVEEDTFSREDVPQPFCGVTHIGVNMDIFSRVYFFGCDNSMGGYVSILSIYIDLIESCVNHQRFLECCALKT
jgi:hypothetical protein